MEIKPNKSTVLATPALTVLQLLQKIAPPDAVIHIGAGAGQGALHQWRTWGVPLALIVDADAERVEWAIQQCVDRPGWHVVDEVLAEADAEVAFYRASNPDRDGIFPPELFASLWPNLHTRATQQRAARSLDGVVADLADAPFATAENLWTFVDCLPALPILRGGSAALARTSVICAQVLLQPLDGLDLDAGIDAITEYLQSQGFCFADVMPGNHPAIGHAVFVKDWKAILEPQIGALEVSVAGLVQEKRAFQEEKAATAADGDAKDGALAQAVAQRDAEAAAKGEAIGQRDALANEKSKLTADRDAQVKAKTEALAQRDAEVAAKTQALTQCDAVTKEKDSLTAAQDSLLKVKADLTSARDAESKAKTAALTQVATEVQAKADLLQHNAHLQADNAVLQARQQLLHEELVKAEAQIDLIKDLLLREPSL